MPRLTSALAYANRELQDFDEVIRLDTEALEQARVGDLPQAATGALANLVLDHTLCGRLDAAQACLDEAQGRATEGGWLVWQEELRALTATAEFRLARGETQAASDNARRLLEKATRHGTAAYAVLAHRVLAEAGLADGHGDQARAHLSAAFEQLERRPAPLLAWRARARG